ARRRHHRRLRHRATAAELAGQGHAPLVAALLAAAVRPLRQGCFRRHGIKAGAADAVMSIDALLFAPVLASTGSECSLTTRRKTGFARQKQTTTVALLHAVSGLV